MSQRRNNSSMRGTVVMFVLSVSCFSVRPTQAAVQVLSFAEPISAANLSVREIQLPQFDPTFGVLESVTFDLHGTGAFIQDLTHFAGSGSHRELEGQQNLTLTLALAGYGELLSLSQQPGHYGAGNAAGGPRVAPIKVSGNTTLNAESELSQFTGSGMVDLFFSARTGHASSAGMNLSTGLWAAGADLVVTYDYAPVPERATWLAAFLALLVVATSRRKALSAG